MAIYHNSFQIIKRSDGRSAVAAAAYRAGEYLVDHTTGIRHNYLDKGRGHVLWSEIQLPRYAPEEWHDRETLWNTVEISETGRNAQLAREFNTALPYECTYDQWLEIAHEYGKWFANQGMCVDIAIHNPDKEIPNPHIHGMLTMRNVGKDGNFAKSKTWSTYLLDVNGMRIPIPEPGTPTIEYILSPGRTVMIPDFAHGGRQKTGQRGRKEYYREKHRTNNWDTKEFLFAARKEWADICNKHLSPEHQIDHRSYEDQGVDKAPSTHDGVAARAVYQKAINKAAYMYRQEEQKPDIDIDAYKRQYRVIPLHQDAEWDREHAYMMVKSHHTGGYHDSLLNFFERTKYTIDGRRRLAIERTVICFLVVVSILIDVVKHLQEPDDNQIQQLQHMRRDTRIDFVAIREIGYTRVMDRRTDMYADCTIKAIKQIIREKERELAVLQKEIDSQRQEFGRANNGRLVERSELYGELRGLRTIVKEKQAEMEIQEKERPIETQKISEVAEESPAVNKAAKSEVTTLVKGEPHEAEPFAKKPTSVAQEEIAVPKNPKESTDEGKRELTEEERREKEENEMVRRGCRKALKACPADLWSLRGLCDSLIDTVYDYEELGSRLASIYWASQKENVPELTAEVIPVLEKLLNDQCSWIDAVFKIGDSYNKIVAMPPKQRERERIRAQAIEITENQGRNYPLSDVPQTDVIIDQMSCKLPYFIVQEPAAALDLVKLARGAENEGDYQIADIARSMIGKYHNGQMTIREAYRNTVFTCRSIMDHRKEEARQQYTLEIPVQIRCNNRDGMDR